MICLNFKLSIKFLEIIKDNKNKPKVNYFLSFWEQDGNKSKKPSKIQNISLISLNLLYL